MNDTWFVADVDGYYIPFIESIDNRNICINKGWNICKEDLTLPEADEFSFISNPHI